MTSRWQDAARLARRTGFGATGAEVDAVVRMGAPNYIATIVAADPNADPGARATPVPPLPVPQKSAGGAKGIDQLTEQIKAQTRQLEAWWYQRMASVQAPFGEKLTFCWHNHFATSVRKVRSPAAMATQNEKLRQLGRGDFRDLGYAMLTDAAMLRWLDGEDNVAGAANENLAREFMELFSLGHDDGYTETDVREGARALTGWVIGKDHQTVTFDPSRHDNGTKTFIGRTGNLGTTQYLDAVLAVAGGPRYLATRWWGQLASDSPPTSELVDRLVAAYGDSRDLGAMFSALLQSPEFTAAQGTIVVNPMEWVIGAVRALKVPLTQQKNSESVIQLLGSLGQRAFQPPTVGGWPSGHAWLSTAAAENRAHAALSFAQIGDLSSLEGSTPSRLDAVAYLLGIASWSDRSADVLRQYASDPRQLVAVALTTPEYLTN